MSGSVSLGVSTGLSELASDTLSETLTATALFCIYDMSGKQIRQKTISDRGEVTYSFTSEGLDVGMYPYSLIIDGKLINTRRMILTK